MRAAIITGVNGQDGSYLAELLLAKKYRVIGAVRNTDRVTERPPVDWMTKVELVPWDPSDQSAMVELFKRHQPAEIYNFAAYSSGSGMFDEAVGIGEVNGLAVARILEAIREVDANIRFCQAASSEMFGEALESPQSEDTPFRPRSPYGAAKVYAHSMIRIYRQRYGLFASSAILFNHESPRRGLGFVTRKVTHQVARIKLGLDHTLQLGNLEARRDWGFAGDYVRAAWLMLQAPQADDYVIATGETHSVRELCECAFRHVGLDYRDHVQESDAAYRPLEAVQLVGNPEKAARVLGWKPEVGFRELVSMMVDSDLRALENSNVN